MARAATPVRPQPERPTARRGRPPRELAGEVDDRILDAARRVFFERGFAGASIDEIARLAQAGKPAIYARFPSKEVLFTAVVTRNSRRVVAQFEGESPAGATIEERLVSIGRNLLTGLLTGDNIDFMRLSVAEVRRFPDLANAGRMARERGAQAVAQALSEVAQGEARSAFPAFAPERLPATVRFFLDLVVTRFLLRALTGEDLEQLRAEIDKHMPRAVAFFLAACRQSGVDPHSG
jgi:AcrR family transcriptional regulator